VVVDELGDVVDVEVGGVEVVEVDEGVVTGGGPVDTSMLTAVDGGTEAPGPGLV